MWHSYLIQLLDHIGQRGLQYGSGLLFVLHAIFHHAAGANLHANSEYVIYRSLLLTFNQESAEIVKNESTVLLLSQ